MRQQHRYALKHTISNGLLSTPMLICYLKQSACKASRAISNQEGIILSCLRVLKITPKFVEVQLKTCCV